MTAGEEPRDAGGDDPQRTARSDHGAVPPNTARAGDAGHSDRIDTDDGLSVDVRRGAVRSVLASFFHDRWRIGLVFAAGIALTLLAAALAPKSYTAEAELLLRLGREYIYKPELGEPATAGAPVAYDREQTLLAEARILTSRDIVDTVLDKLGAERVFPDLREPAWRRWWREMTGWGVEAPAPAVPVQRPPALPPRSASASAPVATSAAAAPTMSTATATAAASPAPESASAVAAASPSTPAGPLRASAVLRFEKALQAELLKGSNLMQVSFVHRDPQIAADVLAEVLDAYLQRRSVIFASGMRGTAQTNFDAREAQLKDAEARLSALKRSRGIQAFAAEQTLLLAQRNGLEERRTESQVALARASGRAASLRDSLSNVSTDVQLSSETQRSDAVEKARSLLLDLKLKEREASSQFSDDSPAVVDVRADIERTNAYLKELLANPVRAVRSGRSPARDAVEADLLRTLADQRQASAGSRTLNAERDATDRRLAELASSEDALKALERERRLAEENFDAAAKSLRDERAMAELDREGRSNVSIVQAPRAPVSGKSLAGVILLVGVFLSLCAALLTAFFSALWRDTFLTPEQVEQSLDLPMLAVVRRDAK